LCAGVRCGLFFGLVCGRHFRFRGPATLVVNANRLAGTTAHNKRCADQDTKRLCSRRKIMDSIIYLVGLIVVVMFILSVLGLR
jgi:hypothetical protein